MRFIADESCDFGVVRTLRQAGFDVTAICEISPRADDTEVIKMASEQKRVLITEDKDFGQLVYAHGEQSPGVVLLRYRAGTRLKMAEDVIRMVQQHEPELASAFTVVEPGRLRIRKAP